MTQQMMLSSIDGTVDETQFDFNDNVNNDE